MNHKKIFLLAVAVGLVFLACSCPLTSGLVLVLGEDLAFGVAVFNLLLDFVVGVFTVWGLFWAATEFSELAVKPKVRVLPGIEAQGQGQRPTLKSRPPFEVVGHWHESGSASNPRIDAHINPRLYLINQTSKAARNVFLVLECKTTPRPSRFFFRYIIKQPWYTGRNRERETRHRREAIWLRFTDDLVVYEDAVEIGNLFTFWSGELDAEALPRQVTIQYDAYSLDGASSDELKLNVKWEHG